MPASFLGRLRRDDRGAALMEFTLVAWVLFAMTFAIVEFAIAFWQYNATVKGVALAVRTAVQSDPVAPALASYNGVLDDDLRPGEALTLPAFTLRCRAGACTCAAGDCSGLGAPGYDAAAFNRILAPMRPVMPFLTDAQLRARVFVEYDHVGMGFAGRPGPDIVPLVSVGLSDHDYDFILMTAFGFDRWPIAVGRATLPAEDLDSTWP
ncbi:TadE/TadG family type IV pilus assembly protein [Novispirillum sp. DQ9]|uniref:TadE/TadG family type IV pilus assembly protein n=1 Tax=Novispirillum sp. DQ9 TaxID=3398612 RepID=UPI003C7AC828